MYPVIDFKRYHSILNRSYPIKVNGKVRQVVGLVVEAHGPDSSVGDLCEIYPEGSLYPVKAEVVGFRENSLLLMLLGETRGIAPGNKIIAKGDNAIVKVGDGLLGRVINGLGEPIDSKGPIIGEGEYPIYSIPINPLHRKRITQPIDIGIKAINGLLSCGKGQRLGILSGTGVGKSVMMGMIARNTSADVSVIALIGERGREVKEFIEKNLGEEGLKRSVVVVATSDQPPLIRTRGAYLATAMAEYFRDRGRDVVFMMDSITRFALAQREIGLSIGEPPTTRGFTPSVFASLPRLLERGGTSSGDGSITGLYAVLVEGDDINEPISDAVRSILDGHIVLSRKLSAMNHYPAIDILYSISRVMIDIVSPEHMKTANRLIEVLATYREAEDLINIGAYVKGSNPKIDYAIKMIEPINDFLRQGIYERSSYNEDVERLKALFK
ncbi:MAG: flagellar protein export ATPase FliI [Nitrospinae bacterium]|nr:flagellar protein export ATPase FliI [Nitrospinota bacterium]